MPDRESPHAIDAVITWVDGDDPKHRRKLDEYLGREVRGPGGAAASTRFSDRGEIEYCVASLLRFAPWLRSIHIVTDEQTPALMAQLKGTRYEHRVQVVDHRTIFAGFEDFLPTFSSLSIESMLWRIPDLAERFVYLNDDFQLIAPVAASDFFRDEGVVLRGKWRAGNRRRWGKRLKSWLPPFLRARSDPVSNHSAQQLTAEMVGFSDTYLQVPHCPHPMRQSVLARYFADHPEQLRRNLGYRLRAGEQFLAVGLADHLEIAAGSAIVDNRLETLRLKPSRQGLPTLRRQLAQAEANPQMMFSCVQSVDQASEEAQVLVFGWLDRRVGRLADLIATPKASTPADR